MHVVCPCSRRVALDLGGDGIGADDDCRSGVPAAGALIPDIAGLHATPAGRNHLARVAHPRQAGPSRKHFADFSVNGPVHVRQSSFSNADNGPGIVFASATEVTFANVTADGNQNAGADFSVNGPLHVSQSSFSNANNGPGIIFASATEVVLVGVPGRPHPA